MSAQSCATHPFPSFAPIASATAGAWNTSSSRSWMASISSRSNRRRATSSETKPVWESISYSPRLNVPTTRSRRARGIMPIGESVPCGVSTEIESPTMTPSCAARSVPSRMAPGESGSGLLRASSVPAPHGPGDRRHLRLHRRIDSLQVDERLVARRRHQRLADDRRCRADDVRLAPQRLRVG